MRRAVVVTDSVACLPGDLVERYSIGVVPVRVVIGEKSYRDGVDITASEVYELLRMNRATPTTSSPTPGDFLEAFRGVSGGAGGIVCVTMRADISMMYNSALEAKEMMKAELPGLDIRVVDSRTAGGAQGFVALEAARAAAVGEDTERVVEVAESMIPRVNMCAALDTLYYLARSGRIPRVAAWAGDMLKIKPILGFAHDGVGLLERARTKSRALQRLPAIMKERCRDRSVHVMVMHAQAVEEAETLRRQIESEFTCVELLVSDFAPTMGVQAGPGVVGLAFYAEEEANVE